ncbi:MULTISPECIES: TetR/AcrR family transcriptional regulator [Paenibacillus]|jgi:AcrR family transcriptional regulator|uniref:TetR/AcrR family transcriptional regulator n=1 Tax=Paenibacillus oceani TaxID=2772510 RepID=A0A927CDT8_9BACL|nr:TetR/AcrR family transcriptional regulator [Paenibacillus oceani]MBD2863980.1 TetR/AcrR family transcriptional regulator [Paenibacillus oceani]MDF2651517.1 TetR family transcriptional regulator [Paenibacillus sp.]
MNGYQQRTEKKKAQIMKVTFELLCKYGIDKISIAEISKLANVSPVTIYNYFGSKDELVRQTFADFMDKTLDKYEQLLEQPIPFQTKMEQILRDHDDIVDHMNVSSMVQANINDPVIREYMEDFYTTRTLPFFEKLIDLGKREGCIELSLSMEAILFYIQMYKEALARPAFLAQASPSMLKDLDRLMYYGLMGK